MISYNGRIKYLQGISVNPALIQTVAEFNISNEIHIDVIYTTKENKLHFKITFGNTTATYSVADTFHNLGPSDTKAMTYAIVMMFLSVNGLYYYINNRKTVRMFSYKDKLTNGEIPIRKLDDAEAKRIDTPNTVNYIVYGVMVTAIVITAAYVIEWPL